MYVKTISLGDFTLRHVTLGDGATRRRDDGNNLAWRIAPEQLGTGTWMKG